MTQHIDAPAAAPAAPDIPQLQRIAAQVRGDVLRAVANAGGGHIGGPFSAADILVALYFRILRIRPDDPTWEDRDRFVLSKGHSSIGLYATLAARGFFPREELMTFDKIYSRLQGLPDMTRLPGLHMATGALGCGISTAVGMALGAKRRKKDLFVYCIVGDGECQEGEVWEAAMIGGRYKLDNLIGILDFNGLQQYGWPGATIAQRLAPWGREELPALWRAWGWRVLEMDGHNMQAILDTLAEAQQGRGSGQPTMVVAHTVKGHGVSYTRGAYEWHAKVPTADELARGLAELEAAGEIDHD
jgi:transketolase